MVTLTYNGWKVLLTFQNTELVILFTPSIIMIISSWVDTLTNKEGILTLVERQVMLSMSSRLFERNRSLVSHTMSVRWVQRTIGPRTSFFSFLNGSRLRSEREFVQYDELLPRKGVNRV